MYSLCLHRRLAGVVTGHSRDYCIIYRYCIFRGLGRVVPRNKIATECISVCDGWDGRLLSAHERVHSSCVHSRAVSKINKQSVDIVLSQRRGTSSNKKIYWIRRYDVVRVESLRSAFTSREAIA